MALTNDRDTRMKDGELVNLGVAASTIIYAGALVAVNGNGLAVPASDTANLNVLGRAEHRADNSAGQDADIDIIVRRNKAFLFDNDGSSPVLPGHIGKVVMVKDDHTIAASSANSIVAGMCLNVTSEGVWIFK